MLSNVHHKVSAATTNATVVKATPGVLTGFIIHNTNAALRKIVFHDAATTPTAGAAVYFSVTIPGLGYATFPISQEVEFNAGIAYTTVTGIADNDTVAVAANDLVINLFYR